MAHIPYGYRIEMGKAVRDEERAERLNVFFEMYLCGLSVENARRSAGVNMASSALREYMRIGTYAGTDYYPPIVPEGMREQIRKEMEKRTFDGTSIFVPPVPVKSKFRMKTVEIPKGTSAEKAAARYAAIEAIENAEKGEQ